MRRGRPSALEFGVFGCVPVVFTSIAIAIFRSIHSFAGDFHKEFWTAGQHLLDGQSPYLLGHAQVAIGLAFPYPALSAVLFAPFALIPRGVSDVVFTTICFVALALTLGILGIRDWRVYGLVLLWAPVINAWQSANLTLLLTLGLALVWRYRDRPALAGAAAAAAVSLKPFVWPVGIWLLATRRYRACVYGLLWGAALNAIAWSVVGWGQLTRYLHDASVVAAFFFRHAYTPVALVLHFGLTGTDAEAVGVVCGLLVAGACLRLARRGGELGAFAAAVALMWLASPVVWVHYFTLALVPLAIARPRLSWIWALPVVLIICGSRSTEAWQILLVLTVIGTMLAAVIRVRPISNPVRVRASHPSSQRRGAPRPATESV